jgi:hypothetical protein
MPEINEANISLLKSVGEEADVSAIYKSERKTDEENDDDTYNDLMIPQNSITEVDEDDNSSNSGSEDLIANEIKFKSGHFNANTSSDSEDSISRGLSFHDIPDNRMTRSMPAPKRQPEIDPLVTNLIAGSMISYLSQAIGTAAQPHHQSQPEDSGDSDFEILNTDELNHS